jgi:hypothetical protein
VIQFKRYPAKPKRSKMTFEEYMRTAILP